MWASSSASSPKRRKLSPPTSSSREDSDDDPDVRWVMPDFADVSEPAIPTTRLNLTASGKAGHFLKGAPRTIGEVRPVVSQAAPPLKTEADIDAAQNVALFLGELINSHPMHKLFSVSNKGVVLHMDDPYSNRKDVVYLRGITGPMREKIWPTTSFRKQVTKPQQIPGGIRAFDVSVTSSSATQSSDQYDQDVHTDIMDSAAYKTFVVNQKATNNLMRRTWQAIDYEALKRGSEAHKQLELYSRVYVNDLKQYGHVKDVDLHFQQQLRLLNLGEIEPAVKTILAVYNLQEYQFIPITAELPVCNIERLGEYFSKKSERTQKLAFQKRQAANATSFNMHNKVSVPESPFLYGTSVDALVYSPRQNSLALLEFTTSTGDIFYPNKMMNPPFETLENNLFNRKRVQHTQTIEYWKQTYGSIFKDNHLSSEVHGFIIYASPFKPESGKTSRPYICHLDPQEQRAILRNLHKAGFN